MVCKYAKSSGRHGESGTRIWECWNSILQRCLNENCAAYRWYGKKGVLVCEEWKHYLTFKEWALENGYQDNLVIDRVDSNGNYCPENCRWITQSENVRRNAKWNVTAWGETKTIGQWLKDPRCGPDKESAIRMRLARGMPPEEAISKSSGSKYRSKG